MPTKPTKRSDIPPRNSDNYKRRLLDPLTPQDTQLLIQCVNYKGSPKHKQNPYLFGLAAFNGKRGDETLCDSHAGFTPKKMLNVSMLIQRGITASLVGVRMFWTVADDGWIFEARLTNSIAHEYHGYPVRPTEAIAEPVAKRFYEWAHAKGSSIEQNAAQTCYLLYGFRL